MVSLTNHTPFLITDFCLPPTTYNYREQKSQTFDKTSFIS